MGAQPGQKKKNVFDSSFTSTYGMNVGGGGGRRGAQSNIDMIDIGNNAMDGVGRMGGGNWGSSLTGTMSGLGQKKRDRYDYKKLITLETAKIREEITQAQRIHHAEAVAQVFYQV